MTTEQRELLRVQVAKAQRAKRKAEQEVAILRTMLILHDARFANPESGLVFNSDTLEITAPDAEQ